MRLAFGGKLWTMLILPVAALSPLGGLLAESPATPSADQSQTFEILKYDLAANRDVPELCFRMSQSVARKPAAPLESFLTVDPSVPLSATPRKDRLCLTGFSFGSAYTVTVKAGLPGVAAILRKDTQFRIEIPSRPPELDFAAPKADLLSRLSGGLPIRSVNVPKIDVQIFHVADSDLPFMQARTPLTASGAATFAPTHGERIWAGSLDIKGEANTDTVTMLPVEQTLGALKPGLYVAVAEGAGAPVDGQALPTQYFTVSDLGLSAYRGDASLLIAARGLSSGAASPGIDVALVAANNRELGRVRTDGNGFARFDSNLLRGLGEDRPIFVLAYGPAGEFAALGLDDTGVNAPPGPIAALIHLDRAVYRPGEAINILALIRSDQGAPVQNRPLTLNVIRPNGATFSSRTLSDQGAGGYNTAITLPETGAEGTWRIEATTDPGDPPIGTATFTVDDAPNLPMSVSVNADSAVIDPTQPANIAVQAQYADGPAANIPGDLRVTLAAATLPFPAFPGFDFGLADENIAPVSLDPLHVTTDGTGKAVVPVKFAATPKSTRPLEAIFTARMFDADGQARERSVEIPVATQSLLLGVRPQSEFVVGQTAHFEVIAVSPDGARQEKPGAGWEILRQEPVPEWYWDGQRFAYRPSFKDSHIAGGAVDIPANGSAMVEANLQPGRYRIEVFDPNGEAISSARFAVGWGPRGAEEPADTVSIKPDKPYFAPGDTANIFVQPPFDADVVLSSADPQIREAVVQHVPAAGATMHLPLPRDVGLSLKLQATAVAPPDAASPALTRRAFGQSMWLSDPAPRTLDVKLELPPTVMPQRTLSIPVTVSGAGDEPVYVRISLLDARPDRSVLEHDSLSDPLVARNMSAVSAYDSYSRIITQSGLSSGSIAERPSPDMAPQAPQEAMKQVGAPLALYSGIVALDKSGKGDIPLAVPDFAGKVMVKVVAWSAGRSGQAEADIAIRYPLNVSLALPNYLAPDDHADLTLALDNADGPRGEYHVSVHAEGAVSLQGGAEAAFNLAEHEQRTETVSLQAHSPGDSMIVVAVKGPNGIAFERHLPLPVRPAALITRHAVTTLKNGAALMIDPALTAGLRPETLSISLTASGASDLDLAGSAQDLTSVGHDTALRTVDSATLDLAPLAVLQSLGREQATTPKLEQAALSLAAYQGGDGGFSLFGTGQSDPWLTAIVADFLTSAKSRGAAIPDVVLHQALDYLTVHIEPSDGQEQPTQQAFATAAYSLKVLAANGRLTIFQLRYFDDRFESHITNPVAVGLIASSFAALGDMATSTAAFARAGTLPADQALTGLFGSDLRDQAMLTALMAESGAVAQPTVAAAAAKTAALAASRHQFSAQEAGWIFRAATAIPPSRAGIKLIVGDKKVEQGGPFTILNAGRPLPPIKNGGDGPVRVALTVTGSPIQSEGKDQAGYEVQRWFFDTSGKPVDPAAVHQGNIAVVVLTGRFTGQGEAHPILIDGPSAGWEIETAEIVNPIGRYAWLKDLTGAANAAVIDGRYVALPRLIGERREFKLAYIARATFDGQFGLPGTSIDDMVQPAMSARAVGSRTRVDPPS